MTTKTTSNEEFYCSTYNVNEHLPARQVQSEMAKATLDRFKKQIDFPLIRSESMMVLKQSLSQVMKPGISGLKEFISSRQLTTNKGESRATVLDLDQPHLNKFIDYFIDCDGLRYLGILEQIELDYEDRCEAALFTARESTKAEVEYLRANLTEITEIQREYQPKGLKEVDFPELLAAEIKILSIDYKPKIMAIRRIHEYGLEMEAYWLNQLENGKCIGKVEIYDIGTQILAELMGQLFSLLVKSCEFLMQVNQDVKKYRNKYTSYSLKHLFSEFRHLLVEEVGAVGETCGGVMIKIPFMTDDDIIEIMTKLYSQVNFVDICICKALRAVIPQIILYELNRTQ